MRLSTSYSELHKLLVWGSILNLSIRGYARVHTIILAPEKLNS